MNLIILSYLLIKRRKIAKKLGKTQAKKGVKITILQIYEIDAVLSNQIKTIADKQELDLK